MINEELLNTLIEQVGLQHLSKLIHRLCFPSIRIHLTPAEYDDLFLVGVSKFGGLPDLPDERLWPTYCKKALKFVAQINLAEASEHDSSELLPKSGMLYFFFNEYYDDGLLEVSKVLFYDGDQTKLKRASRPTSSLDLNMNPDLNYPNHDGEYFSYKAMYTHFVSELTLPTFGSFYLPNNLIPTFSKTPRIDREKFDQFLEDVRHTEHWQTMKHRMLGHADEIQGDIFWYAERQMNENARWRELYYNPDSGYETWVLLLQVDSDRELGTEWNDSGRIYFCIKREQLNEKQFDKVVAILQCH